MDIWNWVYKKIDELEDAGHERLAELMDDISTDSLSNNHDAIDLYADEAIRLARDLKQPWVEIHIRHWRLQSKVMIRQQPKEMMREAVELLEFSHRPEHIDCPQSVCVVQDLTACYGATDGIGYFQERINVCEETIKRITPRWPCFNCVSVEHLSALYDNGDYDEALKRLAWVDQQFDLAGLYNFSEELELTRALVLIRLGKFKSPIKTLRRIVNSDESEVFRLHARVLIALAHACGGNTDLALKQLPGYDQIENNGFVYLIWIEVHSLCAEESDTTPDRALLDTCMSMLRSAEERGVYRDTLTMGAMVVKLFVAAGDMASANEALAIMKRVKPLLRADLGASSLIGDTEALLSS